MIKIKPNINFEAVQFKDDVESVYSICELFPSATISVNYQHEANPIMSIQLNGHKIKKLIVGDWIIKHPFNDFGTIIVMSDEKFNYYFNIEE